MLKSIILSVVYYHRNVLVSVILSVYYQKCDEVHAFIFISHGLFICRSVFFFFIIIFFFFFYIQINEWRCVKNRATERV